MANINDDDLTPEELHDMARACLAEVLNAAANVAELQLYDDCREEIYAMCDLVAAYYDIDRTVLDDQGEPLENTNPGTIPGTINMRSLGSRFSVRDSDPDE